MRALITGADGFVGKHLARYLLSQPDATVFGTTFLPTERYADLANTGVHLVRANLTEFDSVLNILKETKADHIYHLAAQSFVPLSFENPWQTLSNNIHAQLNILHSVLQIGSKAHILVVGSGEEYGAVASEDIPINEKQPLRPSSPYSVSKVTQDMLGLQYYLSHNLHVIRVRPFNHIGPGQGKGFVASDFASQVAEAEAGLREPIIHVGNLAAQRDFTDVRDVVRAYYLLLEKGSPGEVYNIGSGQPHSIQYLLDTLLNLSEAAIEISVEDERFRPVDVPVLSCDAHKLRQATGWAPHYLFEDTLADILNDWRSRVGAQSA